MRKQGVRELEAIAHAHPGIVGEYSRWVTSQAVKPQPVLSLSAAISLVATLKAQRVRTETDLRTNLYICALAPSGAGKNHPLECLRATLLALGLQDLISGEPASGSALLKALADQDGTRLVLWDEFGQALAGMLSGKGFEREVLTYMMKLFSLSSTFFSSKELAGAETRSVLLRTPCLNVLAASTPGRFYECLTSSLASDGFVARWICWEAENTERVDTPRSLTLPQALKEKLYRILDLGHRPPGNLAILGQVEPETIPLEETARPMFREFREHFDARAAEPSAQRDHTESLWSRSCEHMMKLALVFSDRSITCDDITTAFLLTENSTLRLCRAMQSRGGETPYERSLKKVLRVIRNEKKLSRQELGARTRFLKSRELTEILDQLEQDGEIHIMKEAVGKTVATYVFAADYEEEE